MIKKFECKTCKKLFEADDNNSVFCPYCHSDNVEPARFHLPSLVSYSGLVVVIGLVVLMIWRFGDNIIGTSVEPQIDEPEPESPIEEITDPPTVEVSEPKFDKNNYTVTVVAKHVPRKLKYYYVRLNHFGDKEVLQKSKDGHFRDIPYCADDGHSYDFAIMDSNADTLLCVPVEQTGFIKQAIISKEDRMTIEQLQTLIDTQDDSLKGVGESDYLAPDYRLTFSGLPSDMKNPESWSEMFDMINFEIWKGVTVSKLDYDDKNRINSVTLKVSM